MRVGEFLRTVLPDEGYLIVATPMPIKGTQKTAWWNNVVTEVPELLAQAREWTNARRDVYFALASYKEQRVWNPTKIDYKTRQPGAWEKRTHENVKLVKSLYLDLDVKPDKPDKHYTSQDEAVAALRAFCKTVGLPKPLLVNSGYGIHAYWPFDTAVEPTVWKPIAENLKAVCVTLGLKADHAVTADEARVLRVPGTVNFKRGAEVPVEIILPSTPSDRTKIEGTLNRYVLDNDVPKIAANPPKGLPPRIPRGPLVNGNLGATNDPLNGNLLVFSCGAMRKMVADRGSGAGYKTWLAGLSLARYCDQPLTMLAAVSDGHPHYNHTEAVEKMNTLTTGPAKCTTFWTEDNATCEACPHWQKITSPSQVGRTYRETPPPAKPEQKFEPLSPPWPYVRAPRDDGSIRIVARETNEDGESKDLEVLPYDLYPSRIMDNTTEEDFDERSEWVFVHPRRGETEFKMPQTMLADYKKLHSFLLSRGIHLNPKHAKATQFYMTAYLAELAKQVDRERMYERLGWHEQRKSFVLPDVIYHRDGTETPHQASRTLEAVTKSALHAKGSLEAWMDFMQFYGGDTYPSSRFFLYCAFGAPLLHMTTHKGVLIAASGDTGQGKTTILEACASIFGDPTQMLIGGGKYGSTMNAMFANLGTNHSIPMFWDDTTEREAEEMREFMLHISTGRGKERMHGNVHDGKIVTWETIVLSSANTDDVHRVMSTGKDSDPHLMRFVSVPFDHIDRSTEAKLFADRFKRGIRENYGHAARIYLPYIVQQYEKVEQIVIREMERFDMMLNVTPEERHWSATAAVAYVGGRIAYKLGVLPFDPKDDEAWIVEHFRGMRSTYKQAASTPADILNEYLEQHVSNTLILSPKQASHVDNIVQRAHGSLLIRNEVDTHRIYVSRAAINQYCTDVKANFRKLEAELVTCGIILRRNCYKVLGADTPFAMGQTRCWEIDRVALSKYTKRK